jgi:uracil-DNA glycosylase
VFGIGPVPAPLLILGEAPGKREVAEGRPFAGDAGKRLDRLLIEAGIARDQAFVTNTVLHRPTNPAGRDRPPRADEVGPCGTWLDAQLALVRPRVILTLGRTATRRLLGSRTRLEDVQGRAHRCGDRWVVPAFHPSPVGLNRGEARPAALRAAVSLTAALLANDQAGSRVK